MTTQRKKGTHKERETNGTLETIDYVASISMVIIAILIVGVYSWGLI